MSAHFEHGQTAYLVGSGVPVCIEVARHDVHPPQYRVSLLEPHGELKRGEQRWYWQDELTRTRPALTPAQTLGREGAGLFDAAKAQRERMVP